MSKKVNQVWVSPNGDEWKVQRPGNQKASKVTETKQEAVQVARQIAQNVGAELFVQNKDGTIGYKNSYGSDTFPPRG